MEPEIRDACKAFALKCIRIHEDINARNQELELYLSDFYKRVTDIFGLITNHADPAATLKCMLELPTKPAADYLIAVDKIRNVMDSAYFELETVSRTSEVFSNGDSISIQIAGRGYSWDAVYDFGIYTIVITPYCFPLQENEEFPIKIITPAPVSVYPRGYIHPNIKKNIESVFKNSNRLMHYLSEHRYSYIHGHFKDMFENISGKRFSDKWGAWRLYE